MASGWPRCDCQKGNRKSIAPPPPLLSPTAFGSGVVITVESLCELTNIVYSSERSHTFVRDCLVAESSPAIHEQ